MKQDSEANSQPVLSIIIATFNSMPLLGKVLESIRAQDLPRDQYEILLLDGGSKDTTKSTGEAFGCRFIPNPKTEPVYAKFLGFHEARGRYVCYLDHDEVLTNSSSLRIRLNVFASHPGVKVVLSSGYKNPEHSTFVNCYINEFGDPFSYFIYKRSKDYRFFPHEMQLKYKPSVADPTCLLFPLSESMSSEIIEIVAAGSMFERDFALQRAPELQSESVVIPHLFYRMLDGKSTMAIMKDDPLVHYSAVAWKSYINKIRWRVINNVFNHNNLAAAGFSGRSQFHLTANSYRKFFFLPYGLSVILPLIDSLRLTWTRRDARYLCHSVLTSYTTYEIIKQVLKKILRLQSPLMSYDGKVRIQ